MGNKKRAINNLISIEGAMKTKNKDKKNLEADSEMVASKNNVSLKSEDENNVKVKKKTNKLSKIHDQEVSESCNGVLNEDHKNNLINVEGDNNTASKSKKKKRKIEDQNKVKVEKINKKLSKIHDPEVLEPCSGAVDEDNKNNLNKVEKYKKTASKNKKEKRKLKEDVELSDVDSIKVNKQEKDAIRDRKAKSENCLNESQGSMSFKNKISLKFLNKDEAEVKDEDIDNFCDDLTEEDNATYENWVQLFEANFKKNKTT